MNKKKDDYTVEDDQETQDWTGQSAESEFKAYIQRLKDKAKEEADGKSNKPS